MPGYLASVRRIGMRGSLRAAWNSLDLFQGDDAEAFLKEKLERISKDPDVQEVALDIILGFGVLAVEADREERIHLARLSPPVTSDAGDKKIPW